MRVRYLWIDLATWNLWPLVQRMGDGDYLIQPLCFRVRLF